MNQSLQGTFLKTAVLVEYFFHLSTVCKITLHKTAYTAKQKQFLVEKTKNTVSARNRFGFETR